MLLHFWSTTLSTAFLAYCFCLLVTLTLAIAIGIVLLPVCYHNFLFLGVTKISWPIDNWHVVDIPSAHVHLMATLNCSMIYNFTLFMSFFDQFGYPFGYKEFNYVIAIVSWYVYGCSSHYECVLNIYSLIVCSYSSLYVRLL